MFGQLGQLSSLLKNAGKIKDSMNELNERMQAARFVGESGGGQVRATVDGRGELQSLKLEPELVASGDVEMIEELTVAAIRQAVGLSRAAMHKEMNAIGGGLGLPNMEQLLETFK